MEPTDSSTFPIASSDVAARLRGVTRNFLVSLPLDGKPMTVFNLDGQPLFLSTDVGAALGYATNAFWSSMENWSDRLRPGKDVIRMDGEDLRAMKDAGAVKKNTPSVILLSESGLYRVLMLSRKPAALRVQEWLADEVLPSIRRTGNYAGNDDAALAFGRAMLDPKHQWVDMAAARRVMRQIIDGHSTGAEIARAGGMRLGTVAQGLNALHWSGVIRRTDDAPLLTDSSWSCYSSPSSSALALTTT